MSTIRLPSIGYKFTQIDVDDIVFKLETAKSSGRKFITLRYRDKTNFYVSFPPMMTKWPSVTERKERSGKYELDLHVPPMGFKDQPVAEEAMQWLERLTERYAEFIETTPEAMQLLFPDRSAKPRNLKETNDVQSKLDPIVVRSGDWPAKIYLKTVTPPVMLDKEMKLCETATLALGDSVCGIFQLSGYIMPKTRTGISLRLVAASLIETGRYEGAPPAAADSDMDAESGLPRWE